MWLKPTILIKETSTKWHPSCSIHFAEKARKTHPSLALLVLRLETVYWQWCFLMLEDSKMSVWVLVLIDIDVVIDRCTYRDRHFWNGCESTSFIQAGITNIKKVNVCTLFMSNQSFELTASIVLRRGLKRSRWGSGLGGFQWTRWDAGRWGLS